MSTIRAYSIEAITAKLFTHVEHEVLQAFPADGGRLLQEGVSRFGTPVMKAIAAKADAEGEPHTMHAYIPSRTTAEPDPEKDVTMYAQMARLFAAAAKAVVDVHGDAGRDAVREGVRTFGESRGAGIAARAAEKGLPNTMEHYLDNYDMERSALFEVETTYHQQDREIEQLFTVCPFGQQWADDETGE
ncbi:L-2-amino-thiazoline-4-carboxylic acid hydrolase [Alkalicoccus chagannorensis]|uniref:L-2-amino-thiazoline-4-carboxylic acid hydrolase n=1 Tax=Alkalicoccus chagannorensis TaxID=427072 RepID=UPI00040B3EDA|nr:L-2-amino-thiazoline-4-carboxylic acid hydrolase [Alkalicoccus chagannorensis]